MLATENWLRKKNEMEKGKKVEGKGRKLNRLGREEGRWLQDKNSKC